MNLPDLPDIEIRDDVNGPVQEAITVNKEHDAAPSNPQTIHREAYILVT